MFDVIQFDKLQGQLAILAARAHEYQKTSDAYRPVSSSAVILKVHKLLKELQQPVKTTLIYADKVGVRSTKHLIEFLLPGLERPLFGTAVIPRLLMWNSYNGECGLSVDVGVLRKTCNNPLTVDKRLMIHAPHSHPIDSVCDIEYLEDRVTAALDYILEHMDADFLFFLSDKKSNWQYFEVLNKLVQGGVISGAVRDDVLELMGEGSLTLTNSNITIFEFYNLVNEVMRKRSNSLLWQEMKNTHLMGNILAAVV